MFAFGLLHGLLHGLPRGLPRGLPHNALLSAREDFNVGVELRQLAVLIGTFLLIG